MTLCVFRAVSSTAVCRLCVSVNSMYHDRHRQHSVVSPGGRHHISTSTQEMRLDGYVSDWTVAYQGLWLGRCESMTSPVLRLSRRVTGEMWVSWHLQYYGSDLQTTAITHGAYNSKIPGNLREFVNLENSRKSRGNVNFLREIKWWYQKWCSIVCCLSTSLKATLPSLGHQVDSILSVTVA